MERSPHLRSSDWLKGSLNFETTSSYALTVTTGDGALLNEATITINVTNINQAPNFVTRSLTISETINIGSTIMSLATVNQDGDTTVEYEIEINRKAPVVKALTISGLVLGGIIEEGQLFISTGSEVTILSADDQLLVKQLGFTWVQTSECQ